LLAATDVVYPQFATHNALTLATIYSWAQAAKIDDYEFQCLHGMGETLYDQVVGADRLNKACRIYAPVGSHQTLLAYLVRRLLENGANSSFVNQIVDANIAIDSLIEDPLTRADALAGKPHEGIVLPAELFGKERKNSAGLDFSNELELQNISARLSAASQYQIQATPLLAAPETDLREAPFASVEPATTIEIRNPADHQEVVGYVTQATWADLQVALHAASNYAVDWQNCVPAERAQILMQAADLFEQNQFALMALAIREAGKSLPNAVAEIREAVDFLRYYAAQVAHQANSMALGPVVCISPWNFPLAIFIGEVSAALAAGNVVLAKPAEQTPLIAYRAVQLLHQAGVPRAALQFLPGAGDTVGAQLVADARVKGVMFTGSTEVAQIINRSLAQRANMEETEIALIAETGGQNAMIVDSSALPEQVVQDALASAFDSAGQRCSALRVLCLQSDIADKTITMLKGAMQELRIGKPNQLQVDIGPVIDREAQTNLQAHIDAMRAAGRAVFALELPPACEHGSFIAPTVIEINSFAELNKEVFGPVLHVLRFEREALPQLIDAINATGYGLTLGIHSRIDETINCIVERAHVGNIYVNRNIVGAVVGVQPFGGEGKSGTGPKAGGPLYLKRLQKNPSTELGGHTIVARPAPALFDTLLEWATTHGHEKIAQLAEHYLRHNPYKISMLLPGPTGENNTLSFAPRGAIFCAASTVSGLLNQLAAVLATGNVPVLPPEAMQLLPTGLPAALKNAIQVADAAQALAQYHLQIALVEGKANLSKYRTNFAAQDGAIVALISMQENSQLPLWRLVAERALCINTTAAGGNASLMTLQN
jgi:RHH-type proline utilization regulon transcriptional repressor/proline dehydrogenase/delta 1-pyrroline-5-carboxylate dehydrogenase